ncbi:TIGR02646 family protein [Planctomycetales bacterium ZRK34]|nr:TIGR02646 family protein [Planctomycetales bacterium ZRK34]
MRAITKGAEPASLTQHRKSPHCDYENYADKDGLRVALHSEQRGLCCYCMGRIRANVGDMKIEHWQCQATYPQQQLVYRNLLGACLGGEGLPRHLQHCDTRKGNDDIRWNPADPAHQIEARLKYDPDGTVRSDDAEFDGQLNNVLNLNHALLRNNRKGILDGVLGWWKAEKPIPTDRIERELDRMTDGGELQPYRQVAVWWLRQKLENRA